MTGPFERAMNITSFGTNTIRGIQTLGRQYNKSRSGI
jgi:hypothetical protein